MQHCLGSLTLYSRASRGALKLLRMSRSVCDGAQLGSRMQPGIIVGQCGAPSPSDEGS